MSLGGLDLLLFDSADADDFLAPPDKVAAYSAQFASLLANPPEHSWLVFRGSTSINRTPALSAL